MSEKFDFKKFITAVAEKATDLLAKLIKCIRKADKRTLLIGVCGAFIALVLVIVIIASVSGEKKDNEKTDAPVSSDSYITEEPSTDEEPVADTIELNGSGFYIVDTENDSSLNMRPTASTDFPVMTKIPDGTRVQVLFVDDADQTDDKQGWGYIEYNGNRGWVSMDYLKAAQ